MPCRCRTSRGVVTRRCPAAGTACAHDRIVLSRSSAVRTVADAQRSLEQGIRTYSPSCTRSDRWRSSAGTQNCGRLSDVCPVGQTAWCQKGRGYRTEQTSVAERPLGMAAPERRMAMGYGYGLGGLVVLVLVILLILYLVGAI